MHADHMCRLTSGMCGLTGVKVIEIDYLFAVPSLAAVLTVVLAIFLGISAFVFGILVLLYVYPSRIKYSMIINRFVAFFSFFRERFQSKYFYLPFFAYFLAALVIGLVFTQSGPGISPDSINYISAGENVYYKNGFYIGYSDRLQPYTAQPPLYPLSIAVLMHLGLDAIQAARLVPVLCFALLMLPLFFLGEALESRLTGHVVCLVCVVLSPLLRVTAYAWTEMLYTFFSVVAILFLTQFCARKPGWKLLCCSALCTALAMLTRYIGVTLLFVGLIVIVLKCTPRTKMGYHILIFGCISSLPITVWIYRNIALVSQFTGATREESTMGLLANVTITLETVLKDFFLVPLEVVNKYVHTNVGLAVVGAFFVLLVCVRMYPAKQKFLLNYLRKNYVVLSYVFVYLMTLIVMRSLWHFDRISYRLMSPIYPFLIVAVTSFIFYTLKQVKNPLLHKTLLLITALLCVLFFLLQAVSFVYYYEFFKDGVGCSSPKWKDQEWITWIERHVPDDATIYSDSDCVLFRLRRPIEYLPLSGDEKAVHKFFERLKNEGNSFIIWFGGSSYLSNDEIVAMNQQYDVLVVVADFNECTIYKTNHDRKHVLCIGLI